jgi:hypothetical protein
MFRLPLACSYTTASNAYTSTTQAANLGNNAQTITGVISRSQLAKGAVWLLPPA